MAEGHPDLHGSGILCPSYDERYNPRGTTAYSATSSSSAKSHSMEDEMDKDGETKKRRRIQQACKACSLRRVRCNGERPCRTCVNTDEDCFYGPVKKRGPAKGTTRRARPQHQRRVRMESIGDSADVKAVHSQSPTAQSSEGDGQNHSTDSQSGSPSLHSPPLRMESDQSSNSITPPLPSTPDTHTDYEQHSRTREGQDEADEIDDAIPLRRRKDSSDTKARVFHDYCTVLYSQWPLFRLDRRDEVKSIRMKMEENHPLMFNAICSLASLLPTDNVDDAESRLQLSSVFLQRARQHLDDSERHPSIESVAALVALSLRESAAGRPIEAAQCCTSASKMIRKLGLHRQWAAARDQVEEDYCNRIYWCAFTVDKVLAVQLGRPSCLPSVESNRTFPAIDKEADSGRHWQYYPSSKVANFNYTSQFATSSYANNMCRLAVICESITAQYTDIGPTQENTLHLHSRLTKWMQETPSALRWHHTHLVKNLPHALYQQLWAQVCMILIHRPHIFSSCGDVEINSHAECTNAAKNIFDILQDYDESFGFACIPQNTAFYLFTAAIIALANTTSIEARVAEKARRQLLQSIQWLIDMTILWKSTSDHTTILARLTAGIDPSLAKVMQPLLGKTSTTTEQETQRHSQPSMDPVRGGVGISHMHSIDAFWKDMPLGEDLRQWNDFTTTYFPSYEMPTEAPPLHNT